jgi:hypothetical protein
MHSTTVTTDELHTQITICEDIESARSSLLRAWNKLGSGVGSPAHLEWGEKMSNMLVTALKTIDPDILL